MCICDSSPLCLYDLDGVILSPKVEGDDML